MIRIYAERTSPRLEFVLDFLYNEWSIDDRPANDVNYHINYSTEPLSARHTIFPSGLLWETGDLRVQDYRVETGDDERVKLLWSSTDREDALSAIFMFLSGIDEWNAPKDDHDRPVSKHTAPCKVGVEFQAIVDEWALGLDADKPAEHWSRVTFDIDHAYAFKGKPLTRMIPATFRDLIKGHTDLFRARMAFLTKGKDPYDTYAIIKDSCQKAGVRPRLFFHVGDQGRWDHPVPYKSKAFKSLIKDVTEWADIGLHPSYIAAEDMSKLRMEKNRLEQLTGGVVEHSRQHFLRVIEGRTYTNLEKVGITHDHSLAYYDKVGFRAGTGRSFPWYDLESERVSGLTLVPYAAMDGTLNEYLEYTPGEAKSLLVKILDGSPESRVIWHNHSLAPVLHWNGWYPVYQAVLEVVSAPKSEDF